ncbi:MAG: beta-ketoacyl-[acyl-carrier-protein] synthase family protein [Victivallaceae bacterium]|nr:beta-ketoacyl-[acyl-carrier-protein] synthase family protein [Victivallaceae bacterium]
MNKVFITGRGLVTPLGIGLPENERALRDGKCGIEFVQEWADQNIESAVAGVVPDFPVHPIITRKLLRFCPLTAVMSVSAAAEAFAEAELALEDIPAQKMAVISGVAGSYLPDAYANRDAYLANGRKVRHVSPCVVPRVMPSSPASNLSLLFGIKGETYDISAACASSAICIINAARLIQHGLYDMVIAGGAEGLDWAQALGFTAMRALSTRYNTAPHFASRPFDRDRDGFVMSSGAGYVLLESEASMKRRGVRPISEISGMASNSNATDMVVPDADASEAVMRACIAGAGLAPEDISYINAHGTATPIGDPIEIEAVKRVFGSRAVVNSTKSNTGHMIGATGAVEVIFTSMMQEKGFISRSLNLDNVDPACDGVDFVRELRTGLKLRHALSNAFAFGGSNACIVLTDCRN